MVKISYNHRFLIKMLKNGFVKEGFIVISDVFSQMNENVLKVRN